MLAIILLQAECGNASAEDNALAPPFHYCCWAATPTYLCIPYYYLL